MGSLRSSARPRLVTPDLVGGRCGPPVIVTHLADEKSEATNGGVMHGCSDRAGYTIQCSLVGPSRGRPLPSLVPDNCVVEPRAQEAPRLTSEQVFTAPCGPHCDGLQRGQESTEGPLAVRDARASEPRDGGGGQQSLRLTCSPSLSRTAGNPAP